MSLRYRDIRKQRDIWEPFLQRLGALYADMDQSYEAVTDSYGFTCHGCEESCCLTHFHHYTLLEYLYLRRGLREWEESVRLEMARRARTFENGSPQSTQRGMALDRRMCPANYHNLCRLYAHRPMICRLHGIAFELRRPGHGIERGPGCALFAQQCRGKAYVPFDRTPFYAAMAELEKELRQETGFRRKLKLSVAEMLLA